MTIITIMQTCNKNTDTDDSIDVNTTIDDSDDDDRNESNCNRDDNSNDDNNSFHIIIVTAE